MNVSDAYLKISEDVIAKMAKLAALEVDGVAELGIVRYNYGKAESVVVENHGGLIEISIEIILMTMKDAFSISEKVQKAIKENVQCMTGIPVSKVCVNVVGYDTIEN